MPTQTNAPRFAFVLLALLGTACSSAPQEPPRRPVTVTPPSIQADKPADYPGVHNVVAYSDGLYSGSVPEGKGFETLADMGVRTIISVDGAQPDVQEAEACGMRYVHLPIGYDGITEQRKLELTRAVRDLPGPIYIHCHHGKHRSAGAAAAVSVSLGWLTNPQAVERMKVSGTAPGYKGLYACATDTRVATNAEIASAPNDFPTHWRTTGRVQTMVQIDDATEHLKAIEKAGWTVPKDHPDLVPVQEAGRIAHLLRQLHDDSSTKAEPPEFAELMMECNKVADSLEAGISGSAAVAELSARFKQLNQSCKDCHVKFRD